MEHEHTHAEHSPAPAKKDYSHDYSQLYTPIAIIIAGALVGAGIYFGNIKSAAVPAQPGEIVLTEELVSKITTENRPFLGSADAPLTMFYWYDYQCPFCKAFDVGHPQIQIPAALPEIMKEYVQSGKLKIVLKDYPFLSDDSITAGLYKHALWELYPEHFSEWHFAMMAKQDEEHAGFGNEETIVALLKTIGGVDANKVKALVAQNKDAYQAILTADQTEGASVGISGTPGFVLGLQKLDGAHPFADFKAMIEKAE